MSTTIPVADTTQDRDAISQQWSHRPQLDGVRALCFFYVFIRHCWAIPDQKLLGAATPAVNQFFSWGAIALYVFFALSGFLLTGMLLAEKNKFGVVSISWFYKRRAFRIFPAYYLMLALASAAIILAPYDLYGRLSLFFRNILPLSLFIGNFTFPFTSQQFPSFTAATCVPLGSMLFPLWSLCVEVQYYLICPVLIAKVRDTKLLLGLVIFFIALSTVSTPILQSLSVTKVWPYNFMPWYFNTLPNLQFILDGALLAVLFDRYRNLERRLSEKAGFLGIPALSILAFVILFIPDCLTNSPLSGPALTCLSIGVPLLLAFTLVSRLAANLLSHPFLVHIGNLSYAMYLVHNTILTLVESHLRGTFHMSGDSHTWLLKALLALIITYLLAVASWHFVERPFIVRARRYAIW